MNSVHQPAGTRARDAGTARDHASATFDHGFDVAANPATLNALLAGADRGTRERRS
jgi:hypothetical protein